jgi:hypothetical protein
MALNNLTDIIFRHLTIEDVFWFHDNCRPALAKAVAPGRFYGNIQTEPCYLSFKLLPNLLRAGASRPTADEDFTVPFVGDFSF